MFTHIYMSYVLYTKCSLYAYVPLVVAVDVLCGVYFVSFYVLFSLIKLRSIHLYIFGWLIK